MNIPVVLLSCPRYNGWGVTLLDSLDTMVIMGLDDLVEKTTYHVANLTFDEASYPSPRRIRLMKIHAG